MNFAAPECLLSNIIKFLPSWSQISLIDLKTTALPGCSNRIFKIQLKSPQNFPNISPNDGLIYREFGKLTDFIDYEAESMVFEEMGKRGMGPKSYGYCQEYRLEELIDAEHPNNKEMILGSFIKAITEPIVRLHSIDMPLKNKEPMMRSLLLEEDEKKSLEKVRAILEEGNFKKDPRFDDLNIFLSSNEVDFLCNLLPKLPEAVTFCHNDLNPTNIFMKKDGISFVFIDFEYACINYRGMDLGGYFIEIAFDYGEFPKYSYRSELFASEEIIDQFCRFYLFFKINDDLKLGFGKFEILENGSEILKGKYNKEEFESSLESLKVEVRVGMLLWLFFSSLWCVYQSKFSKIEFDFVGMAFDKFQLYKHLKKKYFGC